MLSLQSYLAWYNLTSLARSSSGIAVSTALLLLIHLVILEPLLAPREVNSSYRFTAYCSTSPFGHHRNRRKFESSGLTWTWRYIPSMSAFTATGSCPKRKSTPSNLFVRFGPWISSSFSKAPWKLFHSASALFLRDHHLGWACNACCCFMQILAEGI